MTSASPGTYATGRLPGGESLRHPGGLALTRRALGLAALPRAARVVDLGCGEGESVCLLRSLGFDAVGIDSADPGPGDFPRLRGNAECLPLGTASADAMLAECSLSLVHDLSRALAECARVLVPGGRLILTDLYARAPAAIGQVRRLGSACIAGIFVREELEQHLAQAGFTVDRWEDHSAALREYIARFLMAGGSPQALWGCGGAPGAEMAAAVRSVRAGYFLLTATRNPSSGETL